MKLILGTDALHPPLTGIGWYTHELASRLQGRSDFSDFRFCNGKTIENKLPDTTGGPPASQRLPNIPLRPQIVRAASRLYRARCSRQLNRLTDWVCHSPNYVLPRTGVSQRNVVTVHDLSIFKYPELHPAKRVEFMRKNLPRSVSNAARIIVASKAIAQEVVEQFGIDETCVRVIPFGVRSVFGPRPEANQSALPKSLANRPYLLFVNGADPRKNLADAARAFELFSAEHADDGWRMAVTGEVEAFSKELKTPGIISLGYPSEAVLAELYRSAQGLCYPSKYEGFGLPVIEALASGTPVLTSRTPTLLEFSGLPGVVTASEDSIEGLVSGMTLLTSSTIRRQAAENSENAQAQFSWERCVESTVACYAELA